MGSALLSVIIVGMGASLGREGAPKQLPQIIVVHNWRNSSLTAEFRARQTPITFRPGPFQVSSCPSVSLSPRLSREWLRWASESMPARVSNETGCAFALVKFTGYTLALSSHFPGWGYSGKDEKIRQHDNSNRNPISRKVHFMSGYSQGRSGPGKRCTE